MDHDSFNVPAAGEGTLPDEMTRELSLAWRIVEHTGANLFLTGKAGTGKTTFLRRLRDRSKKRMVVLAPTGVAAINAGGATIHSFFQFPLSPFVPGKGFVGEESYFRLSRNTRRILAGLDLLVIDEISMVRPDLLDGIDMALRRYCNPLKPFGGVQLLLIGDLRQLSPVVREPDRAILGEFYPSPYFFDSIALREAGFLTIELQTVFRQSDRRFIDMLNEVREGTAGESTLRRLNLNCRPGFDPPESEGYIRLTTHNRRASEINRMKLEAIDTPSATYEARIKGWFPESAYPAERVVELKTGAQVMFIKNDGPARRYYNGMIATVVRLAPDGVTVEPRDGSPEIFVEAVTWENTHYAVDDSTGAIKQETEGTFTQIPLRLAWAITIHKSQGLTFDKAIIDAASSFAPGQAYVALSRCRSLEGMVLDTPLSSRAIITDPGVSRFVEESNSSRPEEETVNRLADLFFMRQLADVFDFQVLDREFGSLARVVMEYLAPLQPGLFNAYKEAQERLAEKVTAVGKRFAARYAVPVADVPAAMPLPALSKKVRSGCRYFLGELESLAALIAGTSFRVENKQYGKRLENACDGTCRQLLLKTGVLREMADKDFSVGEYLAVKARVAVALESGPVSPIRAVKGIGDVTVEKKPKEKKSKEKKPKGYSKFESLRLFEAGKRIEDIAAERGLTTGTVVGHLAECVAIGRLGIERLVSAESLRRLNELTAAGPAADWQSFISRIGDSVPVSEALIYYKSRSFS